MIGRKGRARTFAVADDGVDSAAVPVRRPRSGAAIPATWPGTFGSDRSTAEQVAAAVIGAAEVGYPHLDRAAVHGNEHLIGRSPRAIIAGGVRREGLRVTSKLWAFRPDTRIGRVGRRRARTPDLRDLLAC